MEAMLIKVDVNENNNKFYHVKLEGDVVIKRWGRVGHTGQTGSQSGGEKAFDRVIAQKKARGYVESKVVSSGGNGRSGHEVKKAATQSLLKNNSNSDLTLLVDKLVAQNAHSILEQSGGQIVFEDGVAQTPLGIIDRSAIEEARNLLKEVEKAKQQKKLNRLAGEYVLIVPQNVGTRRGWHETFWENNRVETQRDFLEQLEASLDWYEDKSSQAGQEVDYSDLFTMKIDVLNSKRTFNQINRTFKKTLNSRHASRDFQLRKVYTVESTNPQAFEAKAKEIGNVQQLWHGTGVHNILSILRKGLFVPGTGNVRVAHGAMFGKGVYFSEQSTKSLNYSAGWWAGRKSSNECFMFLGDVAMGTEFHPRHLPTSTELSKLHSGTRLYGKVRDSINVKGGKLVMNHEAIVWNTDQINLRYLCEFG